jgi:hypothetical protein
MSSSLFPLVSLGLCMTDIKYILGKETMELIIPMFVIKGLKSIPSKKG